MTWRRSFCFLRESAAEEEEEEEARVGFSSTLKGHDDPGGKGARTGANTHSIVDKLEKLHGFDTLVFPAEPQISIKPSMEPCRDSSTSSSFQPIRWGKKLLIGPRHKLKIIKIKKH